MYFQDDELKNITTKNNSLYQTGNMYNIFSSLLLVLHDDFMLIR